MTHRRTLLRGAVLGVILDGVLTLAGALSAHRTPHGTTSSQAPETGIATAGSPRSQPVPTVARPVRLASQTPSGLTRPGGR